MNYLLTMEELRTLAALLGVTTLAGFDGDTAEVSREDALRSVLSLTKRGFLLPEEEGFRCERELQHLAVRLVASQRCLLFTAGARNIPQMLCYAEKDAMTILETVVERKKEYRLYECTTQELLERLCADYLPERDTEPGDGCRVAQGALEKQGNELYCQPELRLCVEVLSPVLRARTACLGVFGLCGSASMFTDDGVKEDYSFATFAAWLHRQIGDEHDSG